MRIAKGTLARLMLAIILFVIAAFGVLFGYSSIRFYQNVRNHEAAGFAVDFSVAGNYQGEFRQKYVPQHGKQFRVETLPPFGSREQMRAALEGVKARLLLVTKGAQGVLDESVDSSAFACGQMGGDYSHAEIRPFTPYLFFDTAAARWEECDLTLEIVEPAKGMEARQQEIVAKNVYCRTAEAFPLLIAWAYIIGGALAALGGFFLMRSGLRRAKKRKEPQHEHADL